ncbi:MULTISPECIES: fimbria/pilus outer membrane usher protein [unclassified Serratia (in: enterobacteria)]|uniref:fimbria/pilus outer membrane usher protein n=1 Tax=unclassified Serratia (in: enterobacteria) TaxID=2647522 RepID=UPI000507CFED|nr:MULTISPECIES: fimbria/pilus outer membrane usher protein [unclassified Serratia (in: enterobacteria)]KFK96378.1 fimbrial assembly protein [Serratia sp. Ag2]KFK99853.1 fimbrial assembly protein [Serratia sp. Ag1]
MKIRLNNSAVSPMLTGALLLTGALPAAARDYFDPALLALAGEQAMTADLSAYETAGGVPEGHYLVELWVNQVNQGQHRLEFKKNAQGVVQPELTPEFLNQLGVNTTALPNFKGLPQQVPLKGELSALIPDAQVHFHMAQLRLDLSIPQIAMQQNARGSVDPALWDDGVPALIMNYNLSGSRNRQNAQAGISSSEQTNLFAGLHGGLNWQAWRLRSDMTYLRNQSSGDVSAPTTQSTRFTNTYLQRDIRAWRSEILAGESNTGNDVFDSIPFRGIKLNSSEEMLPGSLRGFAPVVSGIAQTNARVTVSQNGNVVYQTYVAPGPFRIDDLYQTGQGGDLTVTISEADGSVRTQTLAFSALPVMQRPGALKYEFTTGRYNGGITQGSREAIFGLGTLMYGLPYDITLYGGGLVAQDYISLVLGTGVSLRAWGALSAEVTTSSTRLDGQDNRQQGASYRIRYAKSLLRTGTAVDLTAYRYSTRHYYSFADFNGQGYQLNDGQMPWSLERQRSNFQVRLSQQLGSWGALYLAAARNDYWGSDRINNTVSAGYHGSYRGVSYGVVYSIDHIKGDGSWPENRQLSLNMQVPFSLFSAKPMFSRNYANYQMTRSNQGEVQQQVGISGNAMDDRLSYSVMQGWSNGEGHNNGTLNAGYQGSKGQVNMGYSYGSAFRSLNLSANGGVVVHPEGVTLGQMLGNSVAVVSAAGAKETSVMNGNVRTDSRGYALVPYLSNYQNNSISLNPATLPDDVEMTYSSLNVYPTKGAVVMAKFATRVGYQALVTLQQGDTSIPFGTVVTVEGTPAGENNTGIVGDAGQVYLSGLPEKGQLTAKWGNEANQQCRAAFSFANSATPAAGNPVRQLTARCENS